MGKRGSKPKRTEVTWSSELAYAVGLLVTDGSLSIDGRHIDVTSKDREQLLNFMRCVDVSVKIGIKFSGDKKRVSYRIQFSDITLYTFLLSIGLTPAKTKTIGSIAVPDEFFFDFVRGLYDGDGTFYSYIDRRWKNSRMYYLIFVSASRDHIDWLRHRLSQLLSVDGHITVSRGMFQLKYAKRESEKLIEKMYEKDDVISLERKRLKIQKILCIIARDAQVGKLVDPLP